jgi:hypothetical protein
MFNNLELYYSINDLISNDNIFSLIQDYSRNSLKEYKAELWNNDIHYGTIIFILEIKYDSTMNYYTSGIIKILLKNNIYIESLLQNEGPKIDFLMNKINVKSTIYMINGEILNSQINININYIIKDYKVYGIVRLI